MEQTFTINDLVRFLYSETSEAERFQLAATLADNYLFNEKFQELSIGKAEIPNVLFLPSSQSVDAILEYSESSGLLTSTY